MKDAHEPIIESEIFEKVQAKKRRSNIEILWKVQKKRKTLERKAEEARFRVSFTYHGNIR